MLQEFILLTFALMIVIYVGGKIDLTFMERKLVKENNKQGGE